MKDRFSNDWTCLVRGCQGSFRTFDHLQLLLINCPHNFDHFDLLICLTHSIIIHLKYEKSVLIKSEIKLLYWYCCDFNDSHWKTWDRIHLELATITTKHEIILKIGDVFVLVQGLQLRGRGFESWQWREAKLKRKKEIAPKFVSDGVPTSKILTLKNGKY